MPSVTARLLSITLAYSHFQTKHSLYLLAFLNNLTTNLVQDLFACVHVCLSCISIMHAYVLHRLMQAVLMCCIPQTVWVCWNQQNYSDHTDMRIHEIPSGYEAVLVLIVDPAYDYIKGMVSLYAHPHAIPNHMLLFVP